MIEVKVVCIDNKNLPSQIPASHRVKRGEWYTVTHVYTLQNEKQKGEIAFDLKEIDLLELNIEFEHWKAERFGVPREDLDKLAELAEQCSHANDFDLNELLEESLVALPMPGELI